MTQDEADALLVNIVEALNVNNEWDQKTSNAMNAIEEALKRCVKKGKANGTNKAATRGDSGPSG